MLTPIPPTECTRAREAASARLDGELSELELAQLDVHLATCAQCAEYAVLIAATAERLRSAELAQPVETIVLPRRRHGFRLVPAAAAAAAVAAIAASSFALGGALGSHAPRSHPAATTIPAPQFAQVPIVNAFRQPAGIRISTNVIAV